MFFKSGAVAHTTSHSDEGGSGSVGGACDSIMGMHALVRVE